MHFRSGSRHRIQVGQQRGRDTTLRRATPLGKALYIRGPDTNPITHSHVRVGKKTAAATISGHLSLIDIKSVSRIFNVASAVSGTDLLVDAVIKDGGLTKTGPGTMELTAVSPTASDTTINQGPLLVNGTLTNSLVRLNAGGTLRGNGAVKGITASGGNIQPVGTLTSTANVALQAGARFSRRSSP
jgi:autotransporter-associated beta strand protein